MLKFFCHLFVTFAVKLRYRVVCENFDFTVEDSKRGTLFLANHVSETDPVIFMNLLWSRFHPRALAVDYLFKIPIVGFFLKLTRSIAVPTVVPGGESKTKLESVHNYYDQVISGLKSGDNILLYPSGKLSRNGREEFEEQNATFLLLQAVSEVNIVLIRSRGLWGSSFSRALTGKTPDLKKGLLNVLKVLFRNFLFFVPKRTVVVEFKSVPRQRLAEFQSKQTLNSFLESWLNKDDLPEPLNLIPYK